MLRKLLADEKVVISVGVHDALSARIMEKAGIKLLGVSGFGCEACLLGKPDVGMLSMIEVVNHSRNIANSVNIPVTGDAEDGYGGPQQVQRVVRELERAGLAGLFIEDQAHPVKCGFLGEHKRVIPMEEMIMKVRAAVDAREDQDFVICARTDSDIISVDEQIKRCNAYIKAGADLVYPRPNNREQFEVMIKAIKAPLRVNMYPTSGLKPKDLEALGFRGIVHYSTAPLLVATQAMMDLAKEIGTTGEGKDTFNRLNVLNYNQFFEFMGLSEVIENDKHYWVEAAMNGERFNMESS